MTARRTWRARLLILATGAALSNACTGGVTIEGPTLEVTVIGNGAVSGDDEAIYCTGSPTFLCNCSMVCDSRFRTDGQCGDQDQLSSVAIEFYANPDLGWDFMGWTTGAPGAENPTTVAVPEQSGFVVVLTAVFVEASPMSTTAGTSGGPVTTVGINDSSGR